MNKNKRTSNGMRSSENTTRQFHGNTTTTPKGFMKGFVVVPKKQPRRIFKNKWIKIIICR